MEYLKDKQKGEERDSCLFCQLASAPEGDRSANIVARSTHNFAAINRYPYTFGHTMIVPYEHVSSPEDMSTAALTDLTVMTNRIMRILRHLADPPAFNIGANIGAAAGAGIAAHYHFHIVPRWHGDANFMVTVGQTQTIAEVLADTCGRMQSSWRDLFGDSQGESL